MLWSGQLPGAPKPDAPIPAIPQAGGVPMGASIEPIRALGRKRAAPPGWAERRQARVDARNAEKAQNRPQGGLKAAAGAELARRRSDRERALINPTGTGTGPVIGPEV